MHKTHKAVITEKLLFEGLSIQTHLPQDPVQSRWSRSNQALCGSHSLAHLGASVWGAGVWFDIMQRCSLGWILMGTIFGYPFALLELAGVLHVLPLMSSRAPVTTGGELLYTSGASVLIWCPGFCGCCRETSLYHLTLVVGVVYACGSHRTVTNRERVLEQLSHPGDSKWQ